MADKKFDQFTSISPLIGSEELVGHNVTDNIRTSINAILNYIGASISQFIILYETDANWASANLTLAEGFIFVSNDDMTVDPKFKISNGVDAWEDLPYFSTKNGLIKIIDLSGYFFTNLWDAKAYIRTFIDENTYPITDESFVYFSGGGIYYFTVPINTEAILTSYFLGDPGSNVSAYIIDELGLITKYAQNAFTRNSGNNVFKDVTFNSSIGTNTAASFRYASGVNTFRGNVLITGTTFFAENSSGKFIFNGNIGSTEGSNYSNFFKTSTSTIFSKASKYTSNSGAIHGDLAKAITNGCNVQFEGINLLNKNRTATIASSGTPTPNIDAIDEYIITALAASATFGVPSGTPYEGQSLLIRIKDNGTARTLSFNAIYRFSSDQPAPTTTIISKTMYLGFVYNGADSKWDCLGWITNI